MAEARARRVVRLHDVHGHRTARASLARARLRDTLPAALLYHGPTGVGKQRLALWTAQLMLCEQPAAEGPCGTCRPCTLAVRLEHPDVHWYFPLPRPKGASTPEKLAGALEEARGETLADVRANPVRPSWTDDVRSFYLAVAQALRRRAQSRPSMSSVQVFIIGDAEMLVPQESSPEAANALLKLLEEPPESTRFILTSSEPGRLLATIRSRTVPLHLPPLDGEEVRAFLVDVAGADPERARRAAGLSHGSIGRALGFLPDGDVPGPLEGLRQEAFHLLRAGLSPRPGEAFKAGLSFKVTGARGLMDLFGFLEEWVRDLAATAAGAPERVINADARDWLVRAARERNLDPTDVARATEVVERAFEQARGNVNPQLIAVGLVAGLRRTLLSAVSAP